MAKALFLILTGKENPSRADLGLISASRSVDKKRYEDLKVIFFGASEEYVTDLKGPALDAFKILYNAGAVDSACIAVAERMGKKEKTRINGHKTAPSWRAHCTLRKRRISGNKFLKFTNMKN
ncbi:protein containing DUF1291 [mine drainage metagenome]|uniref:Protein containing DUF1291 n=1 Tax=mine drainage metagenome TaxID=410659 RepID=T0YUL3_9ZZZZ